ncbi:hypothetical protein AHF37_00823 [Paragonimus kellicotti]|nr:hypothetical protein AHF37_00823 [Paragonimus kellicotti]
MALSLLPYVSVTKEFRGIHFAVQSFLKDFHCLHLELRDKSTEEEWHAQLSSDYIEELTRKTGSFKRFQTFVCMLQNALTQSSEALHLDVVSYGDLEILRRNKSNGTPFNESLPFDRDKRFLILTYVTEFDKIHYPLPLKYVGPLSPAHLNAMIQELRLELCGIKFNGKVCPSSPCTRSGSDQTAEVVRLQEQNKKLAQEISRLQAQPILQVHPFNLPNDSCTQAPLAHDIRSLVDNLENELFEEKSKAAREATRHRQEVSRLRAELNTSNSCQRSLNRRVEQLTKELILFKRGCPSKTPVLSRSRSASLNGNIVDPKRSCSEHLYNDYHRLSRRDVPHSIRPSSLVQGFSSPRDTSPYFNSSLRLKRRAGSASPTLCRPTASPLCEGTRRSLASLSRLPSMKPLGTIHSDVPSLNCLARPRTASVDRSARYGSRLSIRRFDPTAYVHEKELQREESAMRRFAERQRMLSANAGCPSRLLSSVNGSQNNSKLRDLSNLNLRYSALSDYPDCFVSTCRSHTSPLAISSSCESLLPYPVKGKAEKGACRSSTNKRWRTPSSDRQVERESTAPRGRSYACISLPARQISQVPSSDDEASVIASSPNVQALQRRVSGRRKYSIHSRCAPTPTPLNEIRVPSTPHSDRTRQHVLQDSDRDSVRRQVFLKADTC